jgi:signal transduction histidine kinase
LFGVARGEPLPRGLEVRYGLLTPDGALLPEAERPLPRALRGEGVEHVELLVKRPDGTTRRALATARPLLDLQGRVVGAVAVFDDVTERVRLEEQLRDSRKLEAVARLAGGVAHDFNNLLTAILGTSDLLLDRLGPDDVLREPAADIREAAQRASVLTRQLLTFSRRQLVQPVVLDLGELLAATGPMLRRLVGPAVEVSLARPPTPARVRIDRGQLVQVLVTLAENARDAMPGGGAFSVAATCAELSEEEARLRPGLRPGGHVALTVSDSGSGMSLAVKEHLFEPFFTTKRAGQGTGLGLSTVYGIVTQAGGHVAAESEPGKGSRFTVLLPLVADAVDQTVARSANGSSPRGTETLLLVEDERLVRRLAAKVLRGAGYTVLEAQDGEEALRILAAETPARIDAIVTDVVMPRMGGEDLADRIARERPGTRVLFMSGYTEHRAEFQRRIDEGAALLQKPFTPDALTRAVRELLDR